MMFFEEFQELAKAPRHLCADLALEGPTMVSNPVCGDLARVALTVRSGVVEKARYNAKGCWPVYGALELACRRLENSELKQTAQWSMQEFLSEVKEVPPSKRHAFSLAYRSAFLALGAVMNPGVFARETESE